MRLLLDIGNTNIKSALYSHGKCTNFEIVQEPQQLFALINGKLIDSVAICSVHPEKYLKVEELMKEKFGLDPIVITDKAPFEFYNDYEDPKSLGMDRLCSIEGSLSKLKNSKTTHQSSSFLLTCDMGTATTINILTPDSHFIGGMIAPGVQTMLLSLRDHTAQLPLVSPTDYKSFFGNETKSSIAAGVINCSVGLIESTRRYIKANYDAECRVFITGGNGQFIANFVDDPFEYVQELTLLGVASLAQKISPTK